MDNTEDKIKRFKEETLQELLSQCTEKQQALFSRMYPNGVTEDKIDWAIQQCERTLGIR